MIKYYLSRIGAMLVTFFIIISLAFMVIRLMPGSVYEDPGDLSPVVIETLNAKYHFDEPVIKQYGYFLANALHGDWGTSLKIRPNTPVFDVLKDRLPITIQLNIISLCLAIPIGLAAGVLMAIKKNTIVDNIISFFVILFISVPSFIFGTVMQYALAYKAGWFPITYSATATGWLRASSMILPIIALSFDPIARITRYLGTELYETLNSDFMLLARTKGLSYGQAIRRHALRNSIIPTLTLLVPMLVNIIGGSMVIENIFSVAGMGRLMVDSINASDHMLTVAILVVYSLITLAAVFVVDILYSVADPRIRLGGVVSE